MKLLLPNLLLLKIYMPISALKSEKKELLPGMSQNLWTNAEIWLYLRDPLENTLHRMHE